MNLLYFKVFEIPEEGAKLYVRILQHSHYHNKKYTAALNLQRRVSFNDSKCSNFVRHRYSISRDTYRKKK